MSKHTLTIDTLATNSQVSSVLAVNLGDGHTKFRNWIRLMDRLIIGADQAGPSNVIQVGIVNPTSTLVSTGAAVAGETFTLNSVVFTARAVAALPNEFTLSAVPAVQAANIAGAVNASVSAEVFGIVAATSAAGTTTFEGLRPRASGAAFTLVEALTNVTPTAWAGGGSSTSKVVFSLT